MKLLIVDDEVIIRTGLSQVIQWHELGIELLKPAASAEEALERISVEKPDILLTDIQMTGKTGLQLAKEVKELFPNMEIIILSGYDDFAYTQQAIRQEVSDYLLKTSRPEEIIKTVLKSKQHLVELCEATSKNHIKQRNVQKLLLQQWVVEDEKKNEDSESMPGFLTELFGKDGNQDETMQILLVMAEGWNESSSMESLLLFAVENMLNDMMKCVTFLHKSRVVVIIRASLNGSQPQHRLRVYQKIEQLLKCKLYATVGELVEAPKSLYISYKTAERAFGYKPWMDQTELSYEEILKRKGGKTVCSHEEEVELSAILLEDDPFELKEWVHRFIQEQMQDPQVTLESFNAVVHSVAIAAHRWLERVLSAIGRQHWPEDIPPHAQLKLDVTPKDALFQYLYSLMKLFHNHLGEGQSVHIQKAMAFIEESLGSDVGLQHVAKYVHLHPSHLSEVFKKEMGMTFGDYVMRKKMQRAMEILTISPAKVSEVAAKVGYEDVKYFSQSFKKFTGKTPSEFREEAGGEAK
jgi:two-component system response regulator YesN